MKKIILIICIIFTISIIGTEEYDLTKDAIRFRVIANSNTSKDILMKELVVKKLSNILFKSSDSKENKKEEIISNISTIHTEIDSLFKTNNYDKTYNISYGYNKFPEKEYNGTKYKEGYYESLVIEIGEAKGNNYWCILYPPLCMIDEEQTNNEKIEYKFKIVEILKDLF